MSGHCGYCGETGGCDCPGTDEPTDHLTPSKVETYDALRKIVTGLGYATLTEAVEHLVELRGDPTPQERDGR